MWQNARAATDSAAAIAHDGDREVPVITQSSIQLATVASTQTRLKCDCAAPAPSTTSWRLMQHSGVPSRYVIHTSAKRHCNRIGLRTRAGHPQTEGVKSLLGDLVQFKASVAALASCVLHWGVKSRLASIRRTNLRMMSLPACASIIIATLFWLKPAGVRE